MASVQIRAVEKYFGGTQVIRGVDVDIEDGQFAVLVGPSGCGKSTLLRMIAGLESITRGEILIGGKMVNDIPPKERDIAMVFQNYALYPHMTVFDNMAFSLMLAKVDKAAIRQRVDRASEILGLGDLLKRYPRQLSGGQRQRVAMGRAIVRDPQVFLFDEPLSNLDAKLRVQMRAELQALHRRLGTTTLYVTHDQVEAMTLAQRMLVMNQGRAEQIGAPLEVYTRPATTFVAGFIGSPPMNLIPGRIEAGGTVLVTEEQAQVRLPRSITALVGRDVLLGVRPEHLEACDEACALLTPQINFVELLGSDSLVYGYLGADKRGVRLAARLHATSTQAHDGALPLRFEAQHMHLFDPASGLRLEA